MKKNRECVMEQEMQIPFGEDIYRPLSVYLVLVVHSFFVFS